ncbi:MAG: MCE family protein [Leptospira sp.]|nr:MCE family protein [Leptospira sp.]
MKKEVIIGIAFSLALLVAFFQTIISTDRKTNQYPYRTKLYYSQIDGIRENTEVLIKGIESGYVISIDITSKENVLDTRHLDENRDKVIELTIALKEPLTLWDNYQVRFKSKTIFSDRIIDIDPGFYPGDDTVYYQPTFQGDNDSDKSFPSARYIDNFFEAANNVITENQNDIRTSVVNLREISDKLLGTDGSLPRLINTTEAYDELDITLATLGITMREGRRYQEGYRKMEQTHPIPFIISASFFGGTTLAGREMGSVNSFRRFAPKNARF